MPISKRGTSPIKGQFRAPKQNKMPTIQSTKKQQTITPTPQTPLPQKTIIPTEGNFKEVPNAPMSLGAIGKAAWDFYWERLILREQASPDFMPSLEIICIQHDVCDNIRETIVEYGAHTRTGRDAIKTMNTISRNIIALQHDFGFTLSSKPHASALDTDNAKTRKVSKPKTQVEYPDQGEIFDELDE